MLLLLFFYLWQHMIQRYNKNKIDYKTLSARMLHSATLQESCHGAELQKHARPQLENKTACHMSPETSVIH